MTTRQLVIYDDATARTFAPFSLTRPLASVRAGVELIGRRWTNAIGGNETRFLSSPHLDGFREAAGDGAAPGVLAPGTIIANARCVVPLGVAFPEGDVWVVKKQIAAVRISKPVQAQALRDGSLELQSLAPSPATAHEIEGRWLEAPWDLVGQLQEQLLDDCGTLAVELARGATETSAECIGKHPIVIERGATVEPYVVLDATAGPIIIRSTAVINAFSRIAGPCFVGSGTHILGGRINGASIGDHCRVHGDLSTSLLFGHANKGHEGFVGHTVIGRWANLGAGTTTSNLKNSYGPVKLWTPGGEQDTGMTFLGSLIGDHAKMGIGTMLGTGTVVGAGANVFGTMRPPKRVPPFAWGDAPPYETFTLAKFIEVAERVMQRRNVTLDAAQRDVFAAAHALAENGEW